MNKNRWFLACGMTVALGAAGYIITTPAPQPAAKEDRVADGRRERPEAVEAPRPERPDRKKTAPSKTIVRPQPIDRSRPHEVGRPSRPHGNKAPIVKKKYVAG